MARLSDIFVGKFFARARCAAAYIIILTGFISIAEIVVFRDRSSVICHESTDGSIMRDHSTVWREWLP